MGISRDILGLMGTALDVVGARSFEGLKICELGNQRMRPGVTKYKTFKKYLKALGAKHMSIDINGKDGAKPLDLSKPIKKYHGKFDIVTNYGTSEHVKKQVPCFGNIHNFCRVGGAMVHVVPKTGYYPKHSYYYYTEDFFRNLSNKCGYKVHFVHTIVRDKERAIVCAVMQKTEGSFEFTNEGIHRL